MNTTISHPNASSITAACILSAGLIVAALIDSHRMLPAAASAATIARPPISEASVQAQVRCQILAAPALHTYVYGHKTDTLQDVKVTNVIYDVKQDAFTVLYDDVWQTPMPSNGPQGSYATLSNNGYGKYYGIVGYPDPVTGGETQHAYITIK